MDQVGAEVKAEPDAGSGARSGSGPDPLDVPNPSAFAADAAKQPGDATIEHAGHQPGGDLKCEPRVRISMRETSSVLPESDSTGADVTGRRPSARRSALNNAFCRPGWAAGDEEEEAVRARALRAFLSTTSPAPRTLTPPASTPLFSQPSPTPPAPMPLVAGGSVVGAGEGRWWQEAGARRPRRLDSAHRSGP